MTQHADGGTNRCPFHHTEHVSYSSNVDNVTIDDADHEPDSQADDSPDRGSDSGSDTRPIPRADKLADEAVVHKDRNGRRSPHLRRLRQHSGSWARVGPQLLRVQHVLCVSRYHRRGSGEMEAV